jgi:hypothetical protein
MAQLPVFISTHALTEFIRHYAPHMSQLEAEQHLERAAASADRLKEKTSYGQEQWQIRDPDCVLVMKQDGRKTICVTVFPEPQLPDTEWRRHRR